MSLFLAFKVDSEKQSKTFRYRLSGQVNVTTIAIVGRAKLKQKTYTKCMSDNFTRSKREKIDIHTCQSKDLPAGCWCTGVRVSRIPLSGVEIELIKMYV